MLRLVFMFSILLIGAAAMATPKLQTIDGTEYWVKVNGRSAIVMPAKIKVRFQKLSGGLTRGECGKFSKRLNDYKQRLKEACDSPRAISCDRAKEDMFELRFTAHVDMPAAARIELVPLDSHYNADDLKEFEKILAKELRVSKVKYTDKVGSGAYSNLEIRTKAKSLTSELADIREHLKKPLKRIVKSRVDTIIVQGRDAICDLTSGQAMIQFKDKTMVEREREPEGVAWRAAWQVWQDLEEKNLQLEVANSDLERAMIIGAHLANSTQKLRMGALKETSYIQIYKALFSHSQNLKRFSSANEFRWSEFPLVVSKTEFNPIYWGLMKDR